MEGPILGRKLHEDRRFGCDYRVLPVCVGRPMGASELPWTHQPNWSRGESSEALEVEVGVDRMLWKEKKQGLEQ